MKDNRELTWPEQRELIATHCGIDLNQPEPNWSELSDVQCAEWFINRVSKMPLNNWLENGEFFCRETGSTDIWGKLGILGENDREEHTAEILSGLFDLVKLGTDDGFLAVSKINDGTTEYLSIFPEPTPKGRILQALEWIKSTLVKRELKLSGELLAGVPTSATPENGAAAHSATGCLTPLSPSIKPTILRHACITQVLTDHNPERN